jgi:hypothetical protein
MAPDRAADMMVVLIEKGSLAVGLGVSLTNRVGDAYRKREVGMRRDGRRRRDMRVWGKDVRFGVESDVNPFFNDFRT